MLGLYYLKKKVVTEARDYREWGNHFRVISVKYSKIGEYYISTIFTGIDSSMLFGCPGKDLSVFETFVVRIDGIEDGQYKHSATWEEALKEHRDKCWEYIDMLD